MFNKQNLGLLLAAVGGYFLWKKHQTKKQAVAVAAMTAALPNDQDVVDVDDFRLDDNDADNVNIFGSYGCRN